MYFVFQGNGAHRDLHVPTPSSPTRRSPSARAARARFHHRDRKQRHASDTAQHRLDLRQPKGGERTGPDERRRIEARLAAVRQRRRAARGARSEEHTSELQSLLRTSYDVFCLTNTTNTIYEQLTRSSS